MGKVAAGLVGILAIGTGAVIGFNEKLPNELRIGGAAAMAFVGIYGASVASRKDYSNRNLQRTSTTNQQPPITNNHTHYNDNRHYEDNRQVHIHYNFNPQTPQPNQNVNSPQNQPRLNP
ncbi:hypothetical protein FJZ18_02150 [Candidatus Pacearchaeota archaeon]|nr:hypothetical protein [Candidatus Pacearchaeota archaeon]